MSAEAQRVRTPRRAEPVRLSPWLTPQALRLSAMSVLCSAWDTLRTATSVFIYLCIFAASVLNPVISGTFMTALLRYHLHAKTHSLKM